VGQEKVKGLGNLGRLHQDPDMNEHELPVVDARRYWQDLNDPNQEIALLSETVEGSVLLRLPPQSSLWVRTLLAMAIRVPVETGISVVDLLLGYRQPRKASAHLLREFSGRGPKTTMPNL
jgi:hypothetical protein